VKPNSLPKISRTLILIAVLCTVSFTVIAILVFGVQQLRLDNLGYDTAVSVKSRGLTLFMKLITFFGTPFFLVPANLIWIGYFLYRKNKIWAISVALVSLTSVGLMSLLKNIFHRQRPPFPLVEDIRNYSFPSGHAFMGIVCFGLFAWWLNNTARNSSVKKIIYGSMALFILVIGLSRIYLRVHYASDVLAGFCAGAAWLVFSMLSIKYYFDTY
jgi:membrane-associated phospholipid phosphatase